HRADVDGLGAQSVCLRLDVLDVDGRNRAVGIRLALGDRDLHAAAFELRPLLVEVDGGLLEAEQAAVEVPARFEVADVVPDPHQIASAGSSRNVFSVRRKSAAGAPSTARWSTVSVSVSSGRTTTSPS